LDTGSHTIKFSPWKANRSRIKSRNNPDMRVELVKDYVKKTFPSTELLDYALAVETVTTSKKDNLILNVDGCIAVCFVDLMRYSGAFTAEEAEEVQLNLSRIKGYSDLRSISKWACSMVCSSWAAQSA
jgi:hypothetical protein